MKTQKEIETKRLELEKIVKELCEHITEKDIIAKLSLKREVLKQFFTEGIITGLSWVLNSDENEAYDIQEYFTIFQKTQQ